MKKIEKNVVSRLKDVHENLIKMAIKAKESADLERQRRLQDRALYLDRLRRELLLRKEGARFPKRVFLSFSRSGDIYADYVRTVVEARGFEVVTGFDMKPSSQDNVLGRVLSGLKRVSLFIGILTPEYKVQLGK